MMSAAAAEPTPSDDASKPEEGLGYVLVNMGPAKVSTSDFEVGEATESV